MGISIARGNVNWKGDNSKGRVKAKRRAPGWRVTAATAGHPHPTPWMGPPASPALLHCQELVSSILGRRDRKTEIGFYSAVLRTQRLDSADILLCELIPRRSLQLGCVLPRDCTAQTTHPTGTNTSGTTRTQRHVWAGGTGV